MCHVGAYMASQLKQHRSGKEGLDPGLGRGGVEGLRGPLQELRWGWRSPVTGLLEAPPEPDVCSFTLPTGFVK